MQEQFPGLRDQSLETEKPMTMGRGYTNKQRRLPQVSIAGGIKLHQLQEEAHPGAYWRALQPRPPFHTSAIISSILISLMANYIWRLLNLHLHLQLSYLKACQVCSTYNGSLKKQENSRKTSISALLTMPKPLTLWITINCGKSWKRWDQTTWPASWETCIQVRKQPLELDMEQQTSSK